MNPARAAEPSQPSVFSTADVARITVRVRPDPGGIFTGGGTSRRALARDTISIYERLMAELLPFLRLDVDVGAAIDLGNQGLARRRLVPISGGSVSGAHAGTILPGGADWQDVLADGSLDIAARYVLKLEDGLVEVDSRGLRHAAPEVLARLDRGEAVNASEYYFRTAIRLRASSTALYYLNSLLLVSVGERRARSVHLDVYRVT